MADAADGPEPADAIDCGRAVEIPDIGSVFDAGHKPRGGFFLAPQAEPSPAGEAGTPFVCTDGAGTAVFDDADEAREDEEFVRCALLRGMNILNSSALIELGAPLGALHPALDIG